MLSIICATAGEAMPALLLHAEKAGLGHAREMCGCSLRGDAGDARELRRCQRAAVHKGMQH
jgi:hypothetical protein